MISPKSIIKRNPKIISKKIDEVIFIIDINQEKFYELNQTASAIWQYLWKPRKFQEIVIHIASNFDTSLPKARKDIAELIGEHLGQLFFIFKK